MVTALAVIGGVFAIVVVLGLAAYLFIVSQDHWE
jgi:hypothetical protein